MAMRAQVFSVILLLACASGIPARYACPEFPEPVVDLAADATPSPVACTLEAGPASYLENWRSELLHFWHPPNLGGDTGRTVTALKITTDGRVGDFCLYSETNARTRSSVLNALRMFRPSEVPTPEVQACIARPRFIATFTAKPAATRPNKAF